MRVTNDMLSGLLRPPAAKPKQPTSRERAAAIVLRYTRRADLGKSGGAHLFRHSMATLMLEGGADIRFIQAMLGHAELSTTQIYTQVAIRRLQQVHANTHPAAMRRARSAPAVATPPTPHPDPENAAEALWDALAAEADEEDAYTAGLDDAEPLIHPPERTAP